MDRADTLKLFYRQDQLGRYVFSYSIDDNIVGDISLEIPIRVAPSPSMESLLASSVGIFLAQLCLAQKIELQFSVPDPLLDSLLPICKLLYDVRSYRDELPILEQPIINTDTGMLEAVAPVLEDKKVVLMWGGGKDSTYSHILLEANGYKVIPIHSNINVRSADAEREAIHKLSHDLNVTPLIINFQFPDMLMLGQMYSKVFDKFPHNNAIPHGRDLILTIASAIVALDNGAQNVCFGHESDLWHKKITYRQTDVYRHDMQSEYGNVLLQDSLRLLCSSLKIFSPIGSLTEFHILTNLIVHYPEIAKDINSCFWGNWCGGCSKCLRYDLIQRYSGIHIFDFQKEPLCDANETLRKVISGLHDRDMPYRNEIMFCLAYLAKTNNSENWSRARLHFSNEILPFYKNDLEEIQKDLIRIYPNVLLPHGFKPDIHPLTAVLNLQ